MLSNKETQYAKNNTEITNKSDGCCENKETKANFMIMERATRFKGSVICILHVKCSIK